MGKKNNKSKKIAKDQKNKDPSIKRNQSQEGEFELEQMQGHFAELEQESMQQKYEQSQKKPEQIQEQAANKVTYLGHCFYCLNYGKTYKLVNFLNQDVCVCILSGLFINNGKILRIGEEIKIRANSSLVLEVLSGGQNEQINERKIEQLIQSQADKMTNEDREGLFQRIISSQNSGVCYQNIGGAKGQSLKVIECSEPWQNLDFAPLVSTNETTLLVGLKNTGKSTLCEYVLNKTLSGAKFKDDLQSRPDFCLLDLDVGRNRTYPGSVSFTVVKNREIVKQVSIWVGEYTVLNNIQTYIKAVNFLYQLYRKDHFGSGLLINTMGYLTGLGQLLIYQIYDIFKPHRVIFMETPETSYDSANRDSEAIQSHKQIAWIKNKMQKKQYRGRLYFGKLRQNYNTQDLLSTFQFKTIFVSYVNGLAETKASPIRFEYLISPSSSLRTFEDLLDNILKGAFKKMIARKHYEVYQQDKMGQIKQLQWSPNSITDMRLVILASINNHRFFQMIGVGFGWKGAIFYDPKILKLGQESVAAILTDGIDFERNFYLVNESKLIWLEEKLGERICYLAPIIKVLGNRGVRNNPGKRIN